MGEKLSESQLAQLDEVARRLNTDVTVNPTGTVAHIDAFKRIERIDGVVSTGVVLTVQQVNSVTTLFSAEGVTAGIIKRVDLLNGAITSTPDHTEISSMVDGKERSITINNSDLSTKIK